MNSMGRNRKKLIVPDDEIIQAEKYKYLRDALKDCAKQSFGRAFDIWYWKVLKQLFRIEQKIRRHPEEYVKLADGRFTKEQMLNAARALQTIADLESANFYFKAGMMDDLCDDSSYWNGIIGWAKMVMTTDEYLTEGMEKALLDKEMGRFDDD